MKKQLLLFLFLLCAFAFGANAQIDFASIKTDKKEDFTEDVNKAALQAAAYLLSSPLEKDNPKRLEAAAFLIRWMSGSPHYTFEMDETATNISKGNEDLLVVYLAAMTNYVLEHKEASADKKAVKLNTVKGVLAYCEAQNVKLTGELKKIKKAADAGELEKYLKL